MANKVKEWPDEFILHERHTSASFTRYYNPESEEMYKRMGYTDLADPTPVSKKFALELGDVLTRIENWRKREEERSLTRMAEIEKQRKFDDEPSDTDGWETVEDMDEDDAAEIAGEMAEIEFTMEEMGNEKSMSVKSDQQPAKLRRSPRLLART